METLKFCPDLTGTEERQGAMIGSGMMKRPILNACIGERCVAYDHGRCLKYKNDVMFCTRKVEKSKEKEK